MRRPRLFAGIVALLALGSVPVIAQSTNDLRVRIVANDETPISGALVAIVDGDRIIAEALSNQHGSVTLLGAPGTHRIKVRRIGYKPYLSSSISLPLTNELVLSIETERIVLDAMLVSASAQCGEIRRDAQTLSSVWDEISKALRASQLRVTDLGGMGTMVMYRRERGIRGQVLHIDSTVRAITTLRPFGVPDPPSLAKLGYVRGTPQAGWSYFGPDEAVLLSNEFAATHCFKVVRDTKKRAGQIGVAFEPAPKHKLADIEGVLWVDEKTAELRDVGFTYVNADILTDFGPGGFAKFLRVPSGAWIVSEWQLSMPRLELTMGYHDRLTQIGTLENGGYIRLPMALSAAVDSAKRK